MICSSSQSQCNISNVSKKKKVPSFMDQIPKWIKISPNKMKTIIHLFIYSFIHFFFLMKLGQYYQQYLCLKTIINKKRSRQSK